MEYRLIKTRGFAGLIPYKKQNTVESKIWQGLPGRQTRKWIQKRRSLLNQRTSNLEYKVRNFRHKQSRGFINGKG